MSALCCEEKCETHKHTPHAIRYNLIVIQCLIWGTGKHWKLIKLTLCSWFSSKTFLMRWYKMHIYLTEIQWELQRWPHQNVLQQNRTYIVWDTVMSLLEAPCTKTSWRALLFRAILGITGALIISGFDIWRLKQVDNSETGLGGHHYDFEQHVPCLAVHVCINYVLEAPGATILWGATIPWQPSKHITQ